MSERIVSPNMSEQDMDDEIQENSLRPRRLDDYIGQDKVKSNLRILLEAANKRGEALDHVLLYGPPGLGKTSLSLIISTEMGVNIQHDLRPGHRARRRPRLDPDGAGGARRALHRRDSPPGARRRGAALLGDGGLRARSGDRQRTIRALGAAAAQALHRRRGHHARWSAVGPPTRPLRRHLPAGLLRPGGAGEDHPPLGAHPAYRGARGRRAGDRPAGARHATHRQPAGAARA